MSSLVQIGERILFNYGVDEVVPAIVESVRHDDVIELSYLYKGQWEYAIAKRGKGITEWQTIQDYYGSAPNSNTKAHSRLSASDSGHEHN